MVFHVGICPWLGEISVYNSENDSNFDAEIEKVLKGDIDKIDFMFDVINAIVDGTLGYASICLHSAYGNDIRKQFIESGLKHGFGKVEIIDPVTAEYCSAVSQAKFKKDGIIWIFDGKSYQMWDKRNNTAKFVGNIDGNLDEMELKQIMSTEKFKRIPSIILHKKYKEMNKTMLLTLLSISRNVPVIAYEFQKWSRCALKLSANMPDFLCYNAYNLLGEILSINIKDDKIMIFESFQSLPIKKWIKIISCENDLSVHLSNKQLELIPVHQNSLFTFMIDKNGIYSYTFDDLLPYYPSDQHLNELRFKIKQLDNSVFEFHKSYFFPTQEIKNYGGVLAAGIDLGNTTCCAAVNRKNGFETVAIDNTGERILPSWVAYDEKREKCGRIVVDRLRYHAKSSASNMKYASIDRYEKENSKSFKIQFHSKNANSSKYPEETTAVLLKYIKEKAEDFKGQIISEAVIVPTLYDIKQCKAVHVAALLAGFKTVNLINESIATAFSYFADQSIPNNSYILVFHLGGSNVTIDLLKTEGNFLEIVESESSPILGAKLLDNMLFDYFSEILMNKYRISLTEEKKYKLMIECQKIKKHLSYEWSDTLKVCDFDPEKTGFIEITQSQFEKMGKIFLMDIEGMIYCFTNKYNISTVLYSGGGSRIPMIIELLKNRFRSAKHLCDENPDEQIAIGAVYYKADSSEKTERYSIPEYTTKSKNFNTVGIRIGTTNCWAAVNRQRGVETIPLDNRQFHRFWPYVTPRIYNMQKMLGKISKDLFPENNRSVKILQDTKRLNSIKDSKAVIQLQTTAGEMIKYPEEITAALLKHIKYQLEEFQGTPLNAAAITVPLNFTKAQKGDYYVASLFAGWDIIHFIPDPIAAIFGYFLENSELRQNYTALVFDLGGSTLEISVLKIDDNEITIIKNSNFTNLGGKNFDFLLNNYFTEKLLKLHGLVISDDKKYKLLSESQKIKKDLSVCSTARLDVDNFDPTNEDVIEISRDEFENLAAELIDEMNFYVISVLDKIDYTPDKVDKIFYVGGGTRMPMIKKILEKIFLDSQHCCSKCCDEVRATGASYYSYYINSSTKSIIAYMLEGMPEFYDYCRMMLQREET